MKIFFAPHDVIMDGYFMIGVEHNTFEKVGMKCSMDERSGSYHLLLPRVLGLSYAQTLRFLRDKFGGKIIGKKGYAYVQFPNSVKKEVKEFLDDINRDLTLAFEIRNSKV